MKRELSVDEKYAVETRRRVERDSQANANTLHLAAIAIYALTKPELETRDEILTHVLRAHFNGQGLDEGIRLDLDEALTAASTYVTNLGLSEIDIAAEAHKNAGYIEENGLPKI